MKLFLNKVFPLFLLMAASFIVATHFIFQLTTEIIAAILITITVIILNKVINNLAILLNKIISNHDQDIFTKARVRIWLVLVFVGIFILYPSPECGYIDDCYYPPFELTETDISYRQIYDSHYIVSDEFTGYMSYNYQGIYYFDTVTRNYGSIIASYYDGTTIKNFAYLDGNIYYIFYEKQEDDSSIATLFQYSIQTKNQLSLLETSSYIDLAIYENKIHVYFEDTNTMNIYDRYFNYLGNESFEFIPFRVDSYQNYDVIQQSNGIYLHYADGSEVQLSDEDNYQHIHFSEEGFYLTSLYSTANVAHPIQYDYNGMVVQELTNYQLDSFTSYINFLEDYYIVNYIDTTFTGNDEDGAPTYYIIHSYDEDINYLGNNYSGEITVLDYYDQLYGIYQNKIYELEEIKYTAAIYYEVPRTGILYWVSIFSIGFVLFRKSTFFDSLSMNQNE